MTDQPICLACGQDIIPDCLRCGNCRKPMLKNHTYHHDRHSRAVHWDCDRPTLKPPPKKRR